ncbi:MAG: type I-D CRISPR-associated helicase Cas3' [Candidatus Nanohalobium sp.]
MQVDPAYLTKTDRKFSYNTDTDFTARKFQSKALDWMQEDTEDIAVLNSPTGSGKTATFIEMCQQRGKTLLVYPTNALIQQQCDRLEEKGIDALNINGNTLHSHKGGRTKELTKKIEMNDVVITNPDILQSVLSGRYFDRANKAIEIFDLFNQVIYDEFHFYSDFACSGIIMQVYTLAKRSSPKIMLASATPNPDVVQALERLHSTREITPTYTEDGSQFRYRTEIERYSSEGILNNRENIASKLLELIEKFEGNTETKIALIFNSVYDSNNFFQYLSQEFPKVYERTEKDNGYDTNRSQEKKEKLILNTTSKGEVGLDYDIQHLFMEKPADADSFIQRFGRAGRRSPARVYLYKTGRLSWPEHMNFPEFEENVRESIGNGTSNRNKIKELMGLRGAYAIHNRETEKFNALGQSGANKEIYEDFRTYQTYGKWRKFLHDLESSLNKNSGLPLSSDTKKLLNFTEHCAEALGSLRGQTLSAKIKYPRGSSLEETSYSILSAFKYYSIESIDEKGKTIILDDIGDQRPSSLTITLPEYSKKQEDVRGPRNLVERDLQKKVHDLRIEKSDLSAESVSKGQLHEFFYSISIFQSVIPKTISYDGYEFKIDHSSKIPEIKEIESV